ncbi:MAG: putative quinol monooxygenase [Pseudomonadota bacterium]
MIHVVAIITAKPGQRSAVLDAFHANVPAVHAEEGCIEYQPVVDAGFGGFATSIGDDSFMVIEKWSSAETLAAHAASQHMAAYAAKVKDLIADRAVHVLANSNS